MTEKNAFMNNVAPACVIKQCCGAGSCTAAKHNMPATRFFKKRSIRFFILWCFAILLKLQCLAQLTQTPSAEQQLEDITQNNSDAETEDDAYLQQMQHYIRHPLNVNVADEDALRELKILSPIHIQNLINYRLFFGKFIDVYELQAVPGWDIGLLQKIRPYIIVSNAEKITEAVKRRFSGGEHSLLARLTQQMEKSKGYSGEAPARYYPGSPQKILVRYKYQFKNLLQYGILAEKDAGEQFFKGRQKQGFDFYSAHFFVRNTGTIKALAIGDFTVNLGQGLVQWQGLAFKKSADVMAVKREAGTILPYNSAGEIVFHRGAGITVQKKKVEATLFVSYKKADANFVTDSIPSTADYVSSLQTSGYHRTEAEAADKGIQRQLAFGGNIGCRFGKLHIALNTVQYKFKWPVQKSNEPYNLYALKGNATGNYSIDYSYTFKNLHFFGEAAVNNSLYKALINGLLISTSHTVDMSFLYRNIAPGYQVLYGNAFTESVIPSNESGLYAGVFIHPNGSWQFSGYADFFKFPWLRARANAPVYGTDFMVQLSYKPHKQVEIYSRYRSGSKAVNVNSGGFAISPLDPQCRKSWRTQLDYKMSNEITLRSRVEMVRVNTGAAQEQGFLGYTEAAFKPFSKNCTVNARLQFFDAGGYESRLYAYETDVLYNYSIPSFFDKGLRYFVIYTYDINKKTTIWIRWAQTIYNDKKSTGSGLDEVTGNKKTEFKLQIRHFF